MVVRGEGKTPAGEVTRSQNTCFGFWNQNNERNVGERWTTDASAHVVCVCDCSCRTLFTLPWCFKSTRGQEVAAAAERPIREAVSFVPIRILLLTDDSNLLRIWCDGDLVDSVYPPRWSDWFLIRDKTSPRQRVLCLQLLLSVRKTSYFNKLAPDQTFLPPALSAPPRAFLKHTYSNTGFVFCFFFLSLHLICYVRGSHERERSSTRAKTTTAEKAESQIYNTWARMRSGVEEPTLHHHHHLSASIRESHRLRTNHNSPIVWLGEECLCALCTSLSHF